MDKYWCKSCGSPTDAADLSGGRCTDCIHKGRSFITDEGFLRKVKPSTLMKLQEKFWIRPKYMVSYTHGGRKLPGDSYYTDMVYRASIQLRKSPHTKVASIPIWIPMQQLELSRIPYVWRLLLWWNSK